MLFHCQRNQRTDRLQRAIHLGLVLVLVAGCGDETTITPCTEGVTRDCTMATGNPGQQACSQGAWTACQEKSGPCTSGAVIACTQSDGLPGQRICEDGQWTACSQLPGQCEEGAYKACTTSAGGPGVRQCIDYQWGECLPEGCKEGESQACATACGTGSEICVKGEWKNCTAPTAQDEVCDGVDNDCDGEVDESCLCVHGKSEPCYEGPEGTLNEGPCRAGVRVCQAGSWGECLNQVLPAVGEICTDTIDNDCNDVVNDGCICTPGEERLCGSDWGECVRGRQTCSPQAEWGPCLNAVGPEPEADFGCDGLDNDCDGVADNGLEPDSEEGNNTCASARTYSLSDLDPAATSLTLTLYPQGDVDYVRLLAVEEPGVVTIPPCCPWPLCNPPEAQCNSVEVELVSPSVTGLQYQISLMTDSCTSPSQTFTDPAAVNIQWEGACGLDDSRTFWVKVSPAQSSSPTYSCLPYTLRLRYRNVPGACQ